MEMEDVILEDVGIGDDKPQIEAKPVKVVDYAIKPVSDKSGKEVGKKLVLVIQHPDRTDKPIEISSVKYVSIDKIKTAGMWINLDSDNKLPFKSAVATMLRFYKKKSIRELKGAMLPTELDENGYLAIKAY